jgi:hypothetical protein
MKIVGIMPVRNEDWCLGFTARAALRWVDALVVLDHLSTDHTAEILSDIKTEHPTRVWLLEDKSPEWEEMRHRQMLLDYARGLKATHIAIIDADECVTADIVPHMREMFEKCPPNQTLQLPWHQMRGDIHAYISVGTWAEQYASVGFVDNPGLHWEARGREKYDFHHRHPMGRAFIPYRPCRRTSGLMHFQFVNRRRLLAKQDLYKMTELIRWGRPPETVNAQYQYATGVWDASAEIVTSDTPWRWLAEYAPLIYRHFRPDLEPWQEAACASLLKKHGPNFFRGLRLHGTSA